MFLKYDRVYMGLYLCDVRINVISFNFPLRPCNPNPVIPVQNNGILPPKLTKKIKYSKYIWMHSGFYVTELRPGCFSKICSPFDTYGQK